LGVPKPEVDPPDERRLPVWAIFSSGGTITVHSHSRDAYRTYVPFTDPVPAARIGYLAVRAKESGSSHHYVGGESVIC
jgi:hypothetical protein